MMKYKTHNRRFLFIPLLLLIVVFLVQTPFRADEQLPAPTGFEFDHYYYSEYSDSEQYWFKWNLVPGADGYVLSFVAVDDDLDYGATYITSGASKSGEIDSLYHTGTSLSETKGGYTLTKGKKYKVTIKAYVKAEESLANHIGNYHNIFNYGEESSIEFVPNGAGDEESKTDTANTTDTTAQNGEQENKDDSIISNSAGYYKVLDDAKAVAYFGAKTNTATAITIPVTVKYGGKTFKVTSIAPGAFKGLNNLTTVTIGKNIKTIGKNAFYGCKKLKKITIKTTKLTAKSVGANAFKGINKKAVIKCPKAKKAAYKKFLLKKGMKKTMTFK